HHVRGEARAGTIGGDAVAEAVAEIRDGDVDVADRRAACGDEDLERFELVPRCRERDGRTTSRRGTDRWIAAGRRRISVVVRVIALPELVQAGSPPHGLSTC